VSAICSCITTVVALVGVLSLVYQIANFNENRRKENEQRKQAEQEQTQYQKEEEEVRVRDALARLYTADMDMHKYLGAAAMIDPLFADKESVHWNKIKQDPERKGKFDSACQMMGDLFEYYILIEPDIKRDDSEDIKKAWIGYIELIWKNSPGFREFIRQTDPEWTRKLMNTLNKFEERRKTEQKT
jgi:hypothetical protein